MDARVAKRQTTGNFMSCGSWELLPDDDGCAVINLFSASTRDVNSDSVDNLSSASAHFEDEADILLTPLSDEECITAHSQLQHFAHGIDAKEDIELGLKVDDGLDVLEVAFDEDDELFKLVSERYLKNTNGTNLLSASKVEVNELAEASLTEEVINSITKFFRDSVSWPGLLVLLFIMHFIITYLCTNPVSIIFSFILILTKAMVGSEDARKMFSSFVSSDFPGTMSSGHKLLLRAFLNKEPKVLGSTAKVNALAMSTTSFSSSSSRSKAHLYVNKLNQNFKTRSVCSFVSEGDLEIPVSQRRIFLPILLQGIVEVKALLDPGSTSCTLHISKVKELEKKMGRKCTRLNRSVCVKVFEKETLEQSFECVVLNVSIALETVVKTINNVPFIVNYEASNVYSLIGTNLLFYAGIRIDARGDYLDLKFNDEASVGLKNSSGNFVPLSPKKAPKLVSATQVSLMALEETEIPVKIVGALEDMDEDLICDPEDNIEDSDGPYCFPKEFHKDDKEIKMKVRNGSNFMMLIMPDDEMGKIVSKKIHKDMKRARLKSKTEAIVAAVKARPKVTSPTNQEEGKEVPKAQSGEELAPPTPIPSSATDPEDETVNLVYKMLDVECVCDILNDRECNSILFADKDWMTNHYRQCRGADKPVHEFRKMKNEQVNYQIFREKIVYVNLHKSFHFNHHLSKKVRIILGYRERITKRHQRFIDWLLKSGRSFQLYRHKSRGECLVCNALPNIEAKELFRLCQETQIFFIGYHPPSQVHEVQKQIDHESPILELQLCDYAHMMVYRHNGKLKVFIHLNRFHEQHHQRRYEFCTMLILKHLALIGAPNKIAILTNWKDQESLPSKQIKSGLGFCKDWVPDKCFEMTQIPKPSNTVAPFQIKYCQCVNCNKLRRHQYLPVVLAEMAVISGLLPELKKTSMIAATQAMVVPSPLEELEVAKEEPELPPPPDYSIPTEVQKDLTDYRLAIAMISATQAFVNPNPRKKFKDQKKESKSSSEDLIPLDSRPKLLDMTEEELQEYAKQLEDTSEYDQIQEDISKNGIKPGDFEDIEELEQDLRRNVYEVPDAEEIENNYHKPLEDWRACVSPENFPKDEKEKQFFCEIMERFQGMFTDNRLAWRHLKVPPVEAQFREGIEPIHHKPTRTNIVKDHIITKKVNELINAKLLVPIEPQPDKYTTNQSRSFLVPHNSQEANDAILGIVDETNLDLATDPKRFRLVIDYRDLNATIINKNALAFTMQSNDTRNIIDQLSSFRAFILLDLVKSFRSIPVTTAMMHRCAFHVNTLAHRHQLWAFRSMPDGCCIAPTTLQSLLMNALSPISEFVSCWVDDLIIKGRDNMHCLENFKQVLTLLEPLNLLFAIEKMVILQEEFTCLGQTIKLEATKEDGEIRPRLYVSKNRVDIFKKCPLPNEEKALRRCLGLSCWIQNHAPSLQLICAPLMEALQVKKAKDGDWSDAQARAFAKLMRLYDDIATLEILDIRKTVYLCMDACRFGCGGILYQFSKERKMRIISWVSKRFTPEMSAYRTAIALEIQGLFYGMAYFAKQLQQCIKAVIVTDAASVLFMLRSTTQNEDPVIQRLSAKLFSLGYAWQLRHAASNRDELIFSDFLSRIHGENTTLTGIPHKLMDEHHVFLDQFKDQYPVEFNEPDREFSYRDLLDVVLKKVLKDPKLSIGTQAKRLAGLLKNVHAHHKPRILEFTEAHAPENLKTKVQKMAFEDGSQVGIRVEKDDPVIVEVNKVEADTLKLSPPRTLRALTPEYLSRLQKQDPHCLKVINHLQMVPKSEQDKKWKRNFRLLAGQLLVTRKNPKLQWTYSNVRIYLPLRAAIYVLAYTHLVFGHVGSVKLNALFSGSFTCFRKTLLARYISSCCYECFLYRYPNSKNVTEGRIPIADYPGHTTHADIMELTPGTLNRTRVKQVLALQDSFSAFTVFLALRDFKTETILAALKRHFAVFPVCERLTLDNAKYFANPLFRETCLNLGIQRLQFVSPNSSTSQARIERVFKHFRALLKLNLETYKRGNPWDVYYATIRQINGRRLTHLDKYVKPGELPPSAEELYFSIKCQTCPLNEFISHLSPSQHTNYKIKYEKIMSSHEKDLRQKHVAKVGKLETVHSVKVGDICVLRNMRRKHHLGRGEPYYLRDLYEVVKVSYRKAKLCPLFHQTRKVMEVHMNDIKALRPSQLLDLLPEEIAILFGSHKSPQEILNSNSPPTIVDNKIKLKDYPFLRNRAGKQSAESLPAIKGPLIDPDDSEDEDENSPKGTKLRYDFDETLSAIDENLMPHQGDLNKNHDGDDIDHAEESKLSEDEVDESQDQIDEDDLTYGGDDENQEEDEESTSQSAMMDEDPYGDEKGSGGSAGKVIPPNPKGLSSSPKEEPKTTKKVNFSDYDEVQSIQPILKDTDESPFGLRKMEELGIESLKDKINKQPIKKPGPPIQHSSPDITILKNDQPKAGSPKSDFYRISPVQLPNQITDTKPRSPKSETEDEFFETPTGSGDSGNDLSLNSQTPLTPKPSGDVVKNLEQEMEAMALNPPEEEKPKVAEKEEKPKVRRPRYVPKGPVRTSNRVNKGNPPPRFRN